MPIYKTTCLSEKEKTKIGQRLGQYLEEYITNNNLSVTQAAENLGISPNKFSGLKGGFHNGRLLTSLDYLKSLAKLEDWELYEFIAYLESKNLNAVKEQSYTWDEQIYKALENISLTTRKKFCDKLQELHKKKEKERIELMCRISTSVASINIEALRLLVEGIEKLK